MCMYKMNTVALFNAKAWRKNGAEAIEYGGEIWINQGHLEKNLIFQIYRTKLNIILTKFKK